MTRDATQENSAVPVAPDAPERVGWLRRAAWLLRLAQVRLRFLLVLAIAFVVVGQWSTIRSYWDKLTRPSSAASAAISPDTEYFCPMDPGVISDWPSKCSICNMALVRRRKGEAVQLPDGVVARMQLSPYRIQLAGIQTSSLEYRDLQQELLAPGVAAAIQADERSADGDAPPVGIKVELNAADLAAVSVGGRAEVRRQDWLGQEPWPAEVSHRPAAPLAGGTVAVHLKLIDRHAPPAAEPLEPGERVTVKFLRSMSDLEPFHSQPSDPPPLSATDARQVFYCPDHPDVLATRRGVCPRDENPLEEKALTPQQRLTWWCPMHPEVIADRAGGACAQCEGMALAPRIVNFRPAGQVLAVPETAVIDTGDRQVVYVETMPGMFDGVEVQLGVRAGGWYPVIRGLEAGQRVATAGAFLIDAETRLNPSLAAAYFGAARGAGGGDFTPESGEESPSESDLETIRKTLAELSAEDRALAAKQKVCPVTGLPLGSMGPPPKIAVAGRDVLICCKGCEGALKKNPDKYLGKKR